MWNFISFLGDPLLWVVISIVMALMYMFPRISIWRGKRRGPRRRKFKKFVVIFLISLYITLGAIQAVKMVADIPRPCVLCPAEGCNPYCLPDSTFPSGHSATIFVFFSSIAIVFRKRWTIPLFIIPVLVAMSRVFLGVHYMYDVVVGSIIGLIIPFLVLESVMYLRHGRGEK